MSEPCVDCWLERHPGEPYPQPENPILCEVHTLALTDEPLEDDTLDLAMADLMPRFQGGATESQAEGEDLPGPIPAEPAEHSGPAHSPDCADPETCHCFPRTPGEALVAKIRAGQDLLIKTLRRPPTCHPTNRASEMGHPCLRYLVYLRTHGDQADPPGDTLQLIFNEGNSHESDIRRWLMDYCGVDVFGTQATFPPNDYQLSGHTDGAVMVAFNGEGHKVGIEIKGLNGSHYPRVNTWQDIKNHTTPFLAKWYPQAQLYMLLDSLPEWVWVIKNKWTGERKGITAPFDPDYVELLTDKAETVNRVVDGGGCTADAPEYHKNPVTCRRCKFFRVCAPPLEFGEGAIMHEDPAFYGTLKRHMELAKDTAEGKKLWSEITEYVGALLGKKETRDIFVNDILVRTSVGPTGKVMRTRVEKVETDESTD